MKPAMRTRFPSRASAFADGLSEGPESNSSRNSIGDAGPFGATRLGVLTVLRFAADDRTVATATAPPTNNTTPATRTGIGGLCIGGSLTFARDRFFNNMVTALCRATDGTGMVEVVPPVAPATVHHGEAVSYWIITPATLRRPTTERQHRTRDRAGADPGRRNHVTGAFREAKRGGQPSVEPKVSPTEKLGRGGRFGGRLGVRYFPYPAATMLACTASSAASDE